MIQQLYSTTVWNQHNLLSGSYQHRGAASLETGDLISRTTESDIYTIGIVRWSWEKLEGKGAHIYSYPHYTDQLPHPQEEARAQSMTNTSLISQT